VSKKKPARSDTKKPAFSVHKDDFKIDTFSAGGPGGQHQNTSNTAVRITHKESGATGIGREYRSQTQNKSAALHRLVESPKFKAWKHKKLWGIKESPEKRVERDMEPSNLLILGREEGQWKIID
jgi:protein subunit release factor B